MKKYAAWTTLSFVLLLVAGCKTAPVPECDGWQKLNPSSGTRAHIVANDRQFAVDVAAHNRFGNQRGCWELKQ